MVESMPSGTGPLSPDFAGIDPDLMQGFVTALERGRDVIGEQSERIRQLLATAETSATALRPIREIEGWIGDELPGLRERLQTINQDLPMIGGAIGTPEQVSAWTGAWHQDPISWGLLAYDEKTGKTSAANAKEGAKLAARFNRLPSSPLGLPDADYDRILDSGTGRRAVDLIMSNRSIRRTPIRRGAYESSTGGPGAQPSAPDAGTDAGGGQGAGRHPGGRA
ncbi:hypothetical protein [Streptosporangium sp. NPDC006007]|uniref:hypothetical protein n=1 Tax=Streptosporangium sp. NPDC006007 TaxID=3154575 RepID=UPI0033A897CC